MKSYDKVIDVRASVVSGAEVVAVEVNEEVIVLDLAKARFLLAQLEATIVAQEKVRYMREMKVRFDLSGTKD